MKRHIVCRTSELREGERKLIEADGKSIGVFNVKGNYYALRNRCPHQFAPLCLGKVTGYAPPSQAHEFPWKRDGEIIRCPWHGWEFDLKTGQSVFNPHKVRTKSYEVAIESQSQCEEKVESYSVEIEENFVVVYV
ncbi:MAG TPA: Rieske (2Fe-2S) protein [Chthoniobacteraceae bacterium]|nr:Rieske (2Fe-2S) protein [Chthoniobacteraceae bacterium]